MQIAHLCLRKDILLSRYVQDVVQVIQEGSMEVGDLLQTDHFSIVMTIRRIENQLLFNQVHSLDPSRVGLIRQAGRQGV